MVNELILMTVVTVCNYPAQAYMYDKNSSTMYKVILNTPELVDEAEMLLREYPDNQTEISDISPSICT